MKICVNCGNQCEDHMKFCANCGTPLAEEQAAEEVIPEETTDTTAEAEGTVPEEAVFEASESDAEDRRDHL